MNLQLVINIITYFSIYLLIAYSFALTYFTTRFFNIAQAITLTSAAYFTYFFSHQIQWPVWLSIPIAVICATVVGILAEIVLFKSLRKRNSSTMAMMITSLGLYIILQNVISILWGDDTKSLRLGEIKVGYNFFGAYITDIKIITIIVCLILFMVCAFIIKTSRIGRNIRAVADNSEMSNVLGISSNRVIFFVFAIGSPITALAGILIAFDSDVNPTMGFKWLLYSIVAMIIGGVGSHWGLVGGALLLAIAQHLASYYFGSQWMDTIAYLILIFFLLLKPLGFSGKQLKKVEI